MEQNKIDMGVDGTSSGEYVTKEAVAGSNIVLTIDANLQRIVENTLASNIQKIASGGFGKTYDAQARKCCGYECKNWRGTCYGKLSRL